MFGRLLSVVRSRRVAASLLVLFAATSFAGCDKLKKGGDEASADSAQTEGAPAAPTAKVGVYTVKTERVPLLAELPGRVVAFQTAQVRPQVDGIIVERLFEEGDLVEEGQVLYKIDDAVYKADVARAASNEEGLRRENARAQELVAKEATSQQEADNAQFAWEKAKAELDLAKINLDYCEVKAKIAGKIGFSDITVGALVTSGQSKEMTTIQQLDPIYVDVNPSVALLLRTRRDFDAANPEAARRRAEYEANYDDTATASEATRDLKEKIDERIAEVAEAEAAGEEVVRPYMQNARVKLVFDDGSEFPETGRVRFIDNSVQKDLGTVRLRAEFHNSLARPLMPGMFVRAFVEEGVRENGILIPQQSLFRNADGSPYVWVVKSDSTVERRPIESERVIGQNCVVDSGLEAGDRVVVEGVQYVAEGASVEATEADAFDRNPAAQPAESEPAQPAPAQAEKPAASEN